MSKTYHFIELKDLVCQFGFDAPPNGTQGSRFRCGKYYFTQTGLEQAGIPILPFDENITEDVELIAGNAFVKTTTLVSCLRD